MPVFTRYAGRTVTVTTPYRGDTYEAAVAVLSDARRPEYEALQPPLSDGGWIEIDWLRRHGYTVEDVPLALQEGDEVALRDNPRTAGIVEAVEWVNPDHYHPAGRTLFTTTWGGVYTADELVKLGS